MSAAIEDRPLREDEPAHDGDSGEHCGNQMTEQGGGGDSASEGGDVRCDVIDRSDKSLVYDVGDSNEESASECHGQEETHHGRSLAEASHTLDI
jgi:hypothetical protein